MEQAQHIIKFLTKDFPPLGDIDWENLANNLSQINRVRETTSYYYQQPGNEPHFPSDLQLRDYQQQAVLNWFRQKGRGTLKMATGSGKTITALAITTELYQKINLQALIVVCPYRHLVTQWARECAKFNLSPLLAFESVQSWQNQLSNQLYNLYTQNQLFLSVITTNSTLISEGFQSQLKFFPPKTLIIGDEAHNLGSQRLEESLPRNIGLRLALSATPDRYYDEDGTEAIFNYFGAVIQPEFTLADAIAKGALVRYLYYPILVELTESEAATYAKLTKRIGWALWSNDRPEQNENLKALLMQRSRLIGNATNKLQALKELMKNRLDTTHTLFYCGDGAVNTPQIKHQQIDAVTRLLGKELGYRVNTYTAETPLPEREKMRQQFERGELQGLVAIRCLDEGVDMPTIKHAIILASSGNPRQFIQRRGRILRPSPGKDQATLFDTIVQPPQLDRETWEVERRLLQKELKRFMEFANLAENRDEARQIFKKLEEQYQLEM